MKNNHPYVSVDAKYTQTHLHRHTDTHTSIQNRGERKFVWVSCVRLRDTIKSLCFFFLP